MGSSLAANVYVGELKPGLMFSLVLTLLHTVVSCVIFCLVFTLLNNVISHGTDPKLGCIRW